MLSARTSLPTRDVIAGLLIGGALLCAALAPLPSFAHLAGGMDLTVDGYLLDFGYDPAPVVAGGTAVFAFNVLRVETQEVITPESIWVRMSNGAYVAFAGTLHPSYGNVTVTLPIPEAGTYDVTARYLIDGKEVQGDFTMTVEEPHGSSEARAGKASVTDASPTYLPYAVAALVAVTSLGIGYEIGRRRQ